LALFQIVIKGFGCLACSPIRFPAIPFAVIQCISFLFPQTFPGAGVKTDRASMANGLELRAPFLDVEFAEFALSIPARLKIDESETKIPLRRAYEKCWVEEVRSGPKRGFESPIEKWLQQPSFVHLCEEYLENRSRKIHSLLQWPLPINKAHPKQIYSLLVLSLWMEKNTYLLP
jgi:asparagine synthase (glutamine-hydrolysing)